MNKIDKTSSEHCCAPCVYTVYALIVFHEFFFIHVHMLIHVVIHTPVQILKPYKMPIFKVTNKSRTLRKTLVAADFGEFIEKGE